MQKTKHCHECEKNAAVLTEVSIPIGNEIFKTKAYSCQKCKAIEMTPKIRKEMDEWGKSLKKDVISPQPFFTEATHHFLDQMASQFGMKKSPFIKALTSYYLNVAVNKPNFLSIQEKISKLPQTSLLNEGTRSKITMPINYMLYSKIKVFCDVWKTTPPKVIEEAVSYGLTLLSVEDENFEVLKKIVEELRQYITVLSQAA